MVAAPQLDPMNPRQLVNTSRQVGEEFRHPLSGPSVPRKFVGRRNHSIRASPQMSDGSRGPTIGGHLFAVQFLQRRNILKRVHLADAAFHEQEDTAFGLAETVRRLRRQGIGEWDTSCFRVSGKQVPQRNPTQPQIGLKQEVTPCMETWIAIRRHVTVLNRCTGIRSSTRSP